MVSPIFATIVRQPTPLLALQPSTFQRDLVALMPNLRALSRKICRGGAIADDMAQEALAKAWRSRDSYEAGTNLKAWLFTILRNEVFSHGRRAWRETQWDEVKGAAIAGAANEQQWAMDLVDTSRAMSALPGEQREALMLVGVGGFSYDESATICGTPVGTVKSRVARARASVRETLDRGLAALPPGMASSRGPRATTAAGELLADLALLVPAGTVAVARN
jgi:RNA polymerase sigma-70 factor (ECF subfamily)